MICHNIVVWFMFLICIQLKAEFSDTAALQQFICTAASNDSIFENRPSASDNPTDDSLVCYLLKEEIMVIAHLGAYCGLFNKFRGME